MKPLFSLSAVSFIFFTTLQAQSTVLVEDKTLTPQGVATNPQGTPFVSTASGIIGQALGNKGWLPFVNTSGSPEGLAFDAAGDLYVADTGRRALLKVRPWGEMTVVASNVSPAHVAVGPGGEIYFTETAASRVLRADPDGKVSAYATAVQRPTGVAVDSTSGAVYVAEEGGTIWRFAPKRARFTSLEGSSQPGGLAIDEKGNLYVARNGAGRVDVLDPSGKLLRSMTLPGPDVRSLAFGGTDLKTLYATEPKTGSVWRLRVPNRSQRLPWEPSRPLRITEPLDGAMLNRLDGDTTAEGLRIRVAGVSRTGPVRVNGSPVAVNDGAFETRVLLKQRQTAIVAEGPNGSRESIAVLWDRHSFPRYRFSTDDNIRFLRDIARNQDRYKSIFEQPYLALWRDMRQKYGTKVHFNIYYETEGFNLTQMPARFRPEWNANRDWIRLSFHARANEPDRPYIYASGEKMRDEYRLVTREIERFAGPELLGPVTTVHWGEATRAAVQALRKEGVRVLAGYFRATDDIPNVSYYLPLTQFLHLGGRDYWKDMTEDVTFVRHDIVVNTVKLEDIEPYLDKIAADPHQSEVMELMIHEQYFYPDYINYEPDYRQRVERAIQWVTRKGYKPVWFGDGFLGADDAQ